MPTCVANRIKKENRRTVNTESNTLYFSIILFVRFVFRPGNLACEFFDIPNWLPEALLVADFATGGISSVPEAPVASRRRSGAYPR